MLNSSKDKLRHILTYCSEYRVTLLFVLFMWLLSIATMNTLTSKIVFMDMSTGNHLNPTEKEIFIIESDSVDVD